MCFSLNVKCPIVVVVFMYGRYHSAPRQTSKTSCSCYLVFLLVSQLLTTCSVIAVCSLVVVCCSAGCAERSMCVISDGADITVVKKKLAPGTASVLM